MAYIKSNNIKVYPSGYRGTTSSNLTISYNPESKLNTEANAKRAMTNLIRYNNYTTYYKGKGDFVITDNYTWNGVPKSEGESGRSYVNFEFFINGYYIRIIDSYLAFKDIINENNPNAIYAKVGFAIANAKEPQSTTDGGEGTIALVDTDNNYITDKHLANLETGSNAGVVLTPGNTNDDALGTIIDFSSLDQNIDSKDCFTGLSLEITPSTSDGYHYFKILEKEDNDYVVPSQSKFILNPQNVFGGTDGDVDKPLNEYLHSDKIDNVTLTTNNLYIPPLKDNNQNRNLVINSVGKVDVVDILEPDPGVETDKLHFVTTIHQDENGQVTYVKAKVQTASNSQYGTIEGYNVGYTTYGKHWLKIDGNGHGYVDDIVDGLPISEGSGKTFYLIGTDSSAIDQDCEKGYKSNILYYNSPENKLYVQNIHSSGEIRANNFYATSDKRLKENLETFNYGPSILDLPIYRYDYIDGPKNQIGCLAQDLHELYPELVKEDRDCYLSIQENKIVYLLIEEVKRLTKRVEELEKKSK